MKKSKDFQSFEELFDKINFKKGREGRSVYSPAAYLSDLLQLLEDKFGGDSDFFNRRFDVKDIELNGENAFSDIAYLDIVNRILENKISTESGGAKAYEVLNQKTFPVNLPFHLQEEKYKQYLKYLEVDASTIYQMFAEQPNADVVAREFLKITEEELALVVQEPTDVDGFFKQHFNLDTDVFAQLSDVETFLELTEISLLELQALLFQNLSSYARKLETVENTELKSVANFSYINHGTSGYADLDEENNKIIWGEILSNIGEGAVSEEVEMVASFHPDGFTRIQRASRLIRLSKMTGILIIDLELIIRTICGNTLNRSALQKITMIKQIQDRFDMPIDECCALVVQMNNKGLGNEKEPMDLFNRVFNNKFTAFDPQFILGSGFTPEKYDDPAKYKMMWAKGDILSVENADYRKRLSKALHISEKDLKMVVEKFRNHFGEEMTTDNLFDVGIEDARPMLDVLYRMSKLVEVLDTTYAELFHLFDILEKDSALRKFALFSVLIPYDPAEVDCYKIIQGKATHTIDASLWLVQVLIGVMEWMQSSDFSGEELKQILTGKPLNEKAAILAEEQKINFLNTFYKNIKPTFFSYKNFVSETFDARNARSIYRTVSDTNQELVSERDQRLVHFDDEKAKQAAEAAVGKLDIFSKEDFLGLGIEEKMVDKIYKNLMLKGYINGDGEILEEAFPQNMADFKINSSSVEEKQELFDVIHDIVKSKNGQANYYSNGKSVDASVFLSDIKELSISDNRAIELYDNLIFNGYIDAEGNIVKPDFFKEEKNKTVFEPNAKIDIYSQKVYKILKAKIDCFYKEQLIIKKESFSDLSLKEIEQEDLLENLRFNEYLDANNAIVDKKKTLELEADEMNLAIQFYPHRHKILAAIQQAVLKFKAPYFTITKEILVEVAGEIVSEIIYNDLENSFLEDGKMNKEGLEFFGDEDNISSYYISPYFTDAYHELVFYAIGNIIGEYEKFQIDSYDLMSVDLEEDSIKELIEEIFVEDGYVKDGRILPEKRAYFLNVENALTFELSGFSDYAKDVFFVLNKVAKEVDAGVKEIYDNLKMVSEKQHQVMMSSVAEYVEMPADVAEVILLHIFKSNYNLIETLAVPVLQQVDEKDRITAVPSDNLFNVGVQRLKQSALLVSKLRLNKAETSVIFTDQSLAEKFPEKLHLPKEMDRFDALMEAEDLIYVFKGDEYWTYSKDDYVLLESAVKLTMLSEDFANLAQVDAVFKDGMGKEWLIGRTKETNEEGTAITAIYFCKNKETETWEINESVFGKVESNFDDIEKIDASFTDKDGKVYLFAGNQYMRYSENLKPDEGYPKLIKGNWKRELEFDLPASFYESIDASFTNVEGITYLFKDDQFVTSDASKMSIPINEFWGRIKNNFDDATRIDAAMVKGDRVYFFSGNQTLAYTDNLENDEVYAVEGSLLTLKKAIPSLPEDFEMGVDAAMQGADGQYYIFKGKKYITLNDELKSIDGIDEAELKSIKDKWGVVRNNIAVTGKVNAAMAGLDGRTYLFSGDQYYRYSKADYATVDEGYPNSISNFWAGLATVDAAFVLDGKTYLFGKNTNRESVYVQYSTNDYSVPDENFPKPINDNWWNLPTALVENGFHTPDAVFVGKDEKIYLFKTGQFVCCDIQHRWWSEPEPVAQRWDSIPFQNIGAAFTGKDGRTYIFEDTPEQEIFEGEEEWEVIPRSINGDLEFVRYSDKNYNRIDDRFPKLVKNIWGKTINNIEKTKTIDAAVTMLSRTTLISPEGLEVVEEDMHTYLFSGNQFFRYTGNAYGEVDNGYPKSIEHSLKEEPRFKNLTNNFRKGIDAIFADERNVYIFKNGECTIISEEKNKVYTNIINQSIQTALIDEGSIYGMTAEGWMHISAIENKVITATPKMPSVLHEVPQEFQIGMDAILNGIDGNTYIFKGNSCYNVSLEKEYPIGEEWGRSSNLFQGEGTIDAAFVGLDGKTYLFSGNQFISYTPIKGAENLPPFADHPPRSIAEFWGGLDNVRVAFVKDDKTYLCEAPDKDGGFRYVCYSGDDYSKPDSNIPMMGDIYWWDMPEDYIEEGFDVVNAVLFDEDNMFLLNDKSFVQYNQTDDIWTYPKPLNRIWRSLPDVHAKFEGVKTAFTGKDNITRFFSENTFVEYHNTPNTGGNGAILEIKDIRTHWGIENNAIIQNNKIDAAVVVDDFATYLFSGNQYFRYTSDDYQFIDEGYPKAIIGNLRKENGFEKISQELESALANDQGVTSILANQQHIYIFEKENCHVFSNRLSRSYEAMPIGFLKNNIEEKNQVDAAFVSAMDETYLFSGNQFFKYSTSDYEYVDEGYPKSISNKLAPEAGFEFLNQFVDTGVDAIFKAPNGEVYLFKGNKYHASDEHLESIPLKEVWGKTTNRFIENNETQSLIDAAFTSADGMTYLFKGDQYVRYSNLENEFVDEGFPKHIRDNWGNLFPGKRNTNDVTRDFEAKIEAAWTFEGNAYFAKGDEYVRYSNNDFTKMDSIYPQKFTAQWTDRNDFLLNDLKIVSRFKELTDQYQGDFSLTNFFYEGIGYQKKPFQMLSTIFDWDVEEVKWLKRHHAFLRPENEMEVEFDLELIIGMYDIFAVANKMGAKPSELYEKVWIEKFVNQNRTAAANALYTQLGMNNSEKDWQILSRQMHDEMNLIRRDALMPYLIEMIDGVEDARDLFEYLLIDVEMGSDAKTSNIKEATAAVQLYFHRYFVSLEEADETSETDLAKKEELKEWWKWMKNYRVWEANRKVFLYPENYIRPELRDTKTPEFKQMEDALLQGVIDKNSVEGIYKSYIDNFSTVGNLKIAGANVYKDGDEDVLLLFGHTRTEPAEYYFRTARFSGDTAEWGAWVKTELIVNSDRVFPVFANGRVLLFWIEIEEYEDSKGSLSRKDAGSQVLDVNTSNSSVKHRAHIKFSYLNHNQKWSPPQNIRRNIDLNYKLDAAYVEPSSDGNQTRLFSGEYCLTSSKQNPSGDIKFIEEYDEYQSLPAEFKKGIDSVTIFKGKRYFFKGKQCVVQKISDGKILYHNTLSGLINSEGQETITIVSANFFGRAHFSEVKVGAGYTIPEYFDAAFTIQDSVFCLIDQEGKYIFLKDFGDYQLRPIQGVTNINNSIAKINFEFFIQTIANKGGQFAPADGVFKDADDTYFVLRNGLYECYTIDSDGKLEPKEGFPKSIKGNLAFNMDKFFNRLHVVWREHDGGYVSLNYTTSREFLLAGKLAPDFIFEEVAFQNNVQEQILKTWKSKLAGGFSNTYNEGAVKKVITNTNNIDTSLQGFSRESERLQKIMNGNIALAEVCRSQINSHNTAIASKIESAKDSLSFLQEGDGQFLEELKNLGNELSTAYKEFKKAKPAKKEQWKAELNELREKILEVQNNDSKSRNDFSKITKNLENGITGLKQSSNLNAVKAIINYNLTLTNDSNSLIQIVSEIKKSKEENLSLPTKWDDTSLYEKFYSTNQDLVTNYNDRLKELDAVVSLFKTRTPLANFPTFFKDVSNELKNIDAKMESVRVSLENVKDIGIKVSNKNKNLAEKIEDNLSELEEEVFGRFDLFHKETEFEINNTTSNFSFGLVDWYVFESEGGTFLCRPREGKENGLYEIIRLTTNSAYHLSSRLFTGGVKKLLDIDTQRTRELPAFKPSKNATGKETPYEQNFIKYNVGKIIKDVERQEDRVPKDEHLDFQGANKTYYWELFFHAPFLIAQALNTAQKFEEAKEWYEFIFDPTKGENVWQFLPFDNEKVEKGFISDPAQLKKYYNDPFDPHAIAGLRINAYRKAIVMNYIDNLLDWGDMLFRQYTMESINEARMLYILAYDLLGKKPQSAGNRILSPDQTYQAQKEVNDIDLHIWDLENNNEVTNFDNENLGEASNTALLPKQIYSIHNSNLSSYFFIPENDLFLEYWDRVEDRLYKIRQSLNIKGIKQPLPLFQPPIDPMAMVLAASSGAGISSAMSSINVSVPHYRFNYIINKAKELVDKLNQFGGELLGTIEKKDAEELNLLQNRQEGIILSMSKALRESQLTEAENNLKALQRNLVDATRRWQYQVDTIETGALPAEEAQMVLMGAALGGNVVGATFQILSAIAYPFPKGHIGPFTFGTTIDPGDIGEGLAKIGEAAQTTSEVFNLAGELAGMVAQQQRMLEDWEYERDAIKFEMESLEYEIEGAELQVKMAALEMEIYEKEVANHESIQNFFKEKFSTQELYQWMTSRLSGMYYQTYQQAFNMAKYAEKAFQYERGIKASEASFVQPNYWNSQRKGLMAGESLGMDLERMEQAFLETDERRLEISKDISLVELDPMAFLQLLKKGVCEFRLTEALFDYDFQGHYCRQIKAISLTITAGEGQTVNATLTQLNHSTIMEADAKAVKFLLNPKEKQPLSIRNNWKSNQQIALSHVGQYDDSNGLFELRFDDERYLPFEGTGAVSAWRLELNGKKGSYRIKDIKDVVMNIKYTALQGGEKFGMAVKGLLKPYATAELIDFEKDFAEEWAEFMDGDAKDFSITLTKDFFPNMGSNKITGLLAKYELAQEGSIEMMVNQDDSLILKDGKHIETPGLSIGSLGSEFTFTVKGTKANLMNVKLVLGYMATV